MHVIPTKWSSFWGGEEIRVLVLASLSMQIVLIFLAPLRKRYANMALNLTLWVSYLLADYVATLALGRILSTQTDSSELTSLWAPFMLLHLGGPDTITSYSLADNDLWWRHLLGLVFQVGVAALVFLQSLPNTWLWLPTVLVFVPGFIKFGERTLALRSASFDNIKDRIISERKKDGELNSPAHDTSGNEGDLILEGWRWFDVFKRLLVDVTFSSDILIKSQDRFSEISSKHALKLVSIELSFLYDILHTKAVHLHSPIGRAFRSFSIISLIAALVIFCLLNKDKYETGDIIITYILFYVGISLEFWAVVFLFFSDWMVVSLIRTQRCKRLANIIVSIVQLILRNGKSRRSSTIGQYNLISFCQRSTNTIISRIMKKLKIKDVWDNMCETKPLPKSLEDMMFAESKRRARNVHIYKVLVQARTYRGSQALERHGQLKSLEWSMKKEFDVCVILWHIATDICYYMERSSSTPNEDQRKVSWMVSNYMVYLLTQRPSMMQLGYGKIRFEEACNAVKAKFKKVMEHNIEGKLAESEARILLLFNRDEGNSSLLVDGCRLAKKMQDLDENIKWLVISETWMEMLGYAAIHCGSVQHAKELSRGGELLTHFWLLMAQMGVLEEHKMEQFQSEFI